jgi:hypothetical protein
MYLTNYRINVSLRRFVIIIAFLKFEYSNITVFDFLGGEFIYKIFILRDPRFGHFKFLIKIVNLVSS